MLFALTAIAVVVGIAWFAPASLLDSRLAHATGGMLRLAGTQGTLWHGRGVVTDARGPGLRFLEWTVTGDDVSVRAVKRANPASWITPQAIGFARDGLPDLAYRRFVANQWTERAGHWLPPGTWQKA